MADVVVENADVGQILAVHVANQGCNPVEKYFAADKSVARIGRGLCCQMLAAAEADLEANGTWLGRKKAFWLQIARALRNDDSDLR